ncbi:MAG TPA: hypothetical protein V6C85_19185 [Allocoleopsis sp.]
MTITIHNSELIKLLSITPDKDGNGAPITLEYEPGILYTTYSKGGMLVKLPYTLNGADDKWSIIVDHTALMNAIAPVKSKDDINLSVVSGDLVITGGDNNIVISSWGKKSVEFDPDLLELDSQIIKLDGKRWADIVSASRVAKFNKKNVNPEIVSKGIHCHAWADYITVSAWSATVSCCRSIALSGHPLSEERQFVLPLEAIDLVASMKPSEVTLTLDYKFQQLLIETDIGYILVDMIQDKYPVHDGIQKATESMIQIKRKELLEAVKTAVDAGAKNITLVFDNGTVIVEAPKVKKQEILADDSTKKFTAAVKVAAGALLEALKAVSAAKILMYFPAAAANSLIIDTVTGVMYIFVVTVKVVAQLVESAADVLNKPEPQREVVATGTNSDGTPFVVEAVEQSLLEEVLSIEEREKKREELAQKYGSDQLELAEAVDTVSKLREKIKHIVKDIDSEIIQIQEQQTNAVKQV